MDELIERHKQEKKDLQGKIIFLQNKDLIWMSFKSFT